MSKIRFPLPDTSHIHSNEFEDVYEPSDDTFLLVDALESDYDYLRDLNPTLCLEVGSGSGCVIAFLASILGKDRAYFAVDINPKAALATQRTAVKNGFSINVIQGNILDSLERKLSNRIDLLIFNPPYVPSSTEELGRTDIVASYAGGENGVAVLEKLMPQISTTLSKNGCFYCIFLEQNKPREIVIQMKNYGFSNAKVR